MDITVAQTTDPFVYYDLFAITSRINRLSCFRQKLDYLGYIGLRVGRFPWHATYNRILLLDDMVREGFRGWVIYMDADAYIANPDFDLRTFLIERNHYSVIAAPGGPEEWCVNAGILLLNLSSEFTRALIAKWNKKFHSQVGRERLLTAETPWQTGLKNDQELLHQVLMTQNLNNHLLTVPLREIGAPASTIMRQLLRQEGGLEARKTRAQKDIDEILKQYQEN